MSGYLTTHVLDTALGKPAEGLEIELYRIEGDERRFIARRITNADGRTDGPILPEDAFETGTYELIFQAGSYLRRSGPITLAPPFLDAVPIRFVMAEATHYHVPLLLAPYGYSTYRGS